MSPRSEKRRRLSRWEVLGAWLRLWTPPRDVDVPPVPWRAIAIGAAVLVAVAILFVAVGIPAVQDSNRSTAARQKTADDARVAARVRRIEAEQTAHRARAAAAASPRERRALIGRLEEAVGEDARARVRGGDLRGRIARVDCVAGPKSRAGGVPPEDDPARRLGGYDCTAVTSDIPGTTGSIGYPFKAVVDFRTGRLTWCKTNPPPGEQVVPDPRKVPELPVECKDPGVG